MNNRIAIILDDITQAKKQGCWAKFKNLLKRKVRKNQRHPILSLQNGDALILELDDTQASYYAERDYLQLLTNGYVRSPLATLVPEENTFFFMKNYNQIFELLQNLLDLEDDEQGVIRVVVQEPVRRVKPVIRFRAEIKEKITIFERFVKIGWNTYKRKYSFLNNCDFIEVDGTVFYIKMDRYGNEYLA